jgi:POT family proton-dependent oligopeptide transporter
MGDSTNVTTARAVSERTLFGHPLGLSVLFGTEMWERFCYYGMRALLTFYMVQFLFLGGEPSHVLGYGVAHDALQAVYGLMQPQQMAALIYGLFTFGTYVSGILGGYLADKLLGQRRAVIVGAITMAAGEFLLMDPSLFFIGLLVLVTGNGFFKPNISTQVGGLYGPGDQRIDSAYSIFYVGINLGALIAPIICGRAAHFGSGPAHWNYGFAAAGIGMLIGLAVNLAGQRSLPPDVRARRRTAVAAAPAASTKLTSLDKRAIVALCVVAFCNLFFWGCYEQQGITIALMAADHTNLATPIGTMDAEDIQSFNPFFIFTLTPVIIAFWAWQARRGQEPSPVVKMAIGCAGTALAYGLLIIPAVAIDAGHKVTWLWLLMAMAMLTVGELYLSPVGLSLFSKAAPAKVASLMMAVNFLSNAAGNYLAGALGFYWAVMTKVHFFAMIAGIAGAAAVAIGALSFVLAPVLRAKTEEGKSVLF